mgnify:CR=1 FL=1
MGSIDKLHVSLNNFRHQAGILTEVVISLDKAFQAESDRLTREDWVKRLRALHATVTKELEEARGLEINTRYAHNKATLPFAMIDFAITIIAAATENRKLLKLMTQAFYTSDERNHPYGAVMVCIGLEGLPDDVRVISISELSRKSDRPESEVIQKHQEKGYLLLTEEAFSRLINRLIIDVQEGRLSLPIPFQTLKQAEILRLEAKKVKWVPVGRAK